MQSAHGIPQAAAPWEPPQPLFLLGMLDFELPLSRAPYIHDKYCGPIATPRVVEDGPRKFISWHEVLQSLHAMKIISQILRMWLNGLLGWFLLTATKFDSRGFYFSIFRLKFEKMSSWLGNSLKLAKLQTSFFPRCVWNSDFQNSEYIKLLILLKKFNELNRKKMLNHLNRFFGEGFNSCTVNSECSGPTKLGKFSTIHNPPRLTISSTFVEWYVDYHPKSGW